MPASEVTPERCAAARIAAAALKRELKKLDTWARAGAVSTLTRRAVVELLHELERRAGADRAGAADESKPLEQRRLGFEVPKP